VPEMGADGQARMGDAGVSDMRDAGHSAAHGRTATRPERTHHGPLRPILSAPGG
jgi:hypothetical protein